MPLLGERIAEHSVWLPHTLPCSRITPSLPVAGVPPPSEVPIQV